MDGAFDDCVKYSSFVPVFLRQVDQDVLHAMNYSPPGEYNITCNPAARTCSSTTALIHRRITRKEKTNGNTVYTPRPDKGRRTQRERL